MKPLSSFARFLPLLAGAVLISGCVYPARTVVVAGPPPPPPGEYIPASPGPGYVWIHGHYLWRNGQYVWAPGHYAVRRGGAVWVEGRYENRPEGYVWVEGHWR